MAISFDHYRARGRQPDDHASGTSQLRAVANRCHHILCGALPGKRLRNRSALLAKITNGAEERRAIRRLRHQVVPERSSTHGPGLPDNNLGIGVLDRSWPRIRIGLKLVISILDQHDRGRDIRLNGREFGMSRPRGMQSDEAVHAPDKVSRP